MQSRQINKIPFRLKGHALKGKINEILNQPLKCTALKRPVNTSKFLVANKDKVYRLKYIECAYNLLRRCKLGDNCFKTSKIGKFTCYEFFGTTLEKEKFKVHLREEIIQKDRVLFLISVFPIKNRHLKKDSNPG